MSKRVRIFISSPGDVSAAREIAALTIERLAQDYARFFKVEPYLWEYEAMLASGHFEDSIEPPSAFDIVVLILWSRLGTHLPERTRVREYRGIDGRAPLTGTEWEFEEALRAARENGVPDLLVYRSSAPVLVDSENVERRQQDIEQLAALDRFWSQHFANKGIFLGAYTKFASNADFAQALDSHLRQLIEKRIATGSGSGDPSVRVWMQAPFRGLESYEFEHGPIFFGQDAALAKAMVQIIAVAEAGSPFLVVLGASGSGKSSLVKAGIVPKLFVPRRIAGAAFLRRVVFRPSDARVGEDLFDALARRLTTQVSEQEGLSELIGPGQSTASLAAHLRNATAEPAYPIGTALGQLAIAARRDGRMLEYETARLVLVVDQLEELFTNESLVPRDRQRFIALLAGFVRSGLVWVIATMRSDFWHRAIETEDLMLLAEGNGRLELVPPTPSQQSQMILRPAAAAGIAFEHHGTTDVPLNEVIAEEVAREPGALPLLSYLLDQLYRLDVVDSNRTSLTFATYEKLGRLEGAIATKAEAVLDGCAPGDRQVLGSVLFSLVQMSASDGDIDRAISRRVPLSAFPLGSPQRRLVDALLHPDARLLVSDAETEGHPTVRVAHEALITRWTRARDFVQGNAGALKVRRRIEERYALWRELRSTTQDGESDATLLARFTKWRSRFGHESGLLSEIDLTDGQRLLREHRSDTEPHLIAYIERSAADDKRIRTRSFRMLASVAGVVTLLAIVASGAGLIALEKQREAEFQTEQTLQAQLRLLTEAAVEHLKDGDVPGGQRIILEVLANSTLKRAPDAINVFQELRAADRQLAVLSGHAANLYAAAFSPDGLRIVTGSDDGTARVWDAATGAQLAVLVGHNGFVYTAAFSADGRRIVTGSNDKNARVWDAATGTQIAVLAGHGADVGSAVFSPDGLRVVTGSDDKTARIWDAITGRQLAVLAGHDEGLTAAFSPDGQRIVTASDDKTARVWDAATGLQLASLTGHDASINTAAFSPDGRTIVTASKDKTARVWDAATGAPRAVLRGHDGNVWAAAFSPDSLRIVTSSADKTACVWDAATSVQLAVLSGHGAWVRAGTFSPDGRRIATASDDKTARIWDAATGMQLAVLSGHGGPVWTSAFSQDGLRIVTSSSDRTARVWNAAAGMQLALLAHADVVMSAVMSPDGQRIVTASLDRTAGVWDSATGAQLTILVGHHDWLNAGAFSPDGRRIATASDDKTARIWDAGTGAELAVLSGHRGKVRAAVFSPDGLQIATASDDRTARIWDPTSGVQKAAMLLGEDGAIALVFSPDGRRIVTDGETIARVWDVDTGVQVAGLSGHGDMVHKAAFSPDGRRIVTASFDKTARIWDAATGAQLTVLAGHDDVVWTTSFSPDGGRIVTGSTDKTARIWDAATGAQIAVLSGHRDVVRAAAFSPDGNHVVTGGDNTARIWDATTGLLLAVLAGHGDIVRTAVFSPDGRHIVTSSLDKTARIWDAQIPADLHAQIEWSQAAQTDAVSELERLRLGLPPDATVRTWPDSASKCDQMASAHYDPDRQAIGVVLTEIAADIADTACATEIATSRSAPRTHYQLGRALRAKQDPTGARREFETAVLKRYPAAQIDLANMLVDASAGMFDPERAASLYQGAWQDGVPIAAFHLGHLYEYGVPDAGAPAMALQPDTTKAWLWYQKGADAGEPNALARFAERDERSALAAKEASERSALLLAAFVSYAAAAQRAQIENWPNEAWMNWRYHRATLARLLAREGSMQLVAERYVAVREKWRAQPQTVLNRIGAALGFSNDTNAAAGPTFSQWGH